MSVVNPIAMNSICEMVFVKSMNKSICPQDCNGGFGSQPQNNMQNPNNNNQTGTQQVQQGNRGMGPSPDSLCAT